MATRTRSLALLVPLMAVFAAPAAIQPDEPDPHQRLEAMPRERRIALSENLERFDKLAPSEQEAIRKLDAEIAKKDVVDQARYRAVLHRYHLWVNGLTEAQKQALKDAPSVEARFNLARQYRLKDLESASTTPRIAGIRTGEYGLVGPYEMVAMLRIWEGLPANKKSELEAKLERGEIRAAFLEQPDLRNQMLKHFSPEDVKTYESRFEHDPEYKLHLTEYFHKIETELKNEAARIKAEATAKPSEAATKRLDAATKKANTIRKRMERPYAEFLYFEDHKPRAVSQKNLERFSGSCPVWLHTMLDPLSADDARSYLTVLYRLMYTDVGEMPAESKAAKPATPPPASTPKPAPKKSGGNDPI